MQGSAGQTPDSSTYEADRTRLITEIKLGLSQVTTNITILSRNLDTINTIGHEFGQLAELWKHFHASTLQFMDEDAEEEQDDQDMVDGGLGRQEAQ
ncbi:hypothetical protein B0O80DRAFT_443859 [Mortierella sp. GBAus27b]|nr:hypothetical protein BGX31_003047 [Mortierella sp. GBA43]KAI8358031.1 hypothetical protein B0O80DRAFT_443859 [Mortierella sp. GBAus27b]